METTEPLKMNPEISDTTDANAFWVRDHGARIGNIEYSRDVRVALSNQKCRSKKAHHTVLNKENVTFVKELAVLSITNIYRFVILLFNQVRETLTHQRTCVFAWCFCSLAP